jgi:hypothetical protein
MTLQSLLELILGLTVGVIAWFLKQLHADFKEYIIEVNKLKEQQNEILSKVLLNEQKSKSNYELLNQLTTEKLQTINLHMDKMATTLSDLSKTLIHLDSNQKVMTTVLEKFMKLEDRILKLEIHESSN